MPVYDYACTACGPFTAMRPMAEFKDPHACPDCGEACQRAFLTAPRISGMDSRLKAAHATNERSRHAPRRSSGHGAGCGCCAPKKTNAAPAAAKSFPSARPWMISH
ncbi:FmdB family zinc ribbon protein [Methylobacterium brachiatum]|uniref:FmdB family zinc ribbon protein n=1 Tax=Methylobacterium brachiatum TaxID=269660 RepID=UPI000EFBFE4D|nr:zinc ribbon domain-containing protein [Methylobacterium brachiatum]AYO83819.1 zinc ribbon domain-containing protein [Methylobacterium brachiatum]